jgi:hypothetical protein
MSRLSPDAWFGLAIIALGAFLLLVLIPFGVTSPSNVRIAVLSPTMWPRIVSAALILMGGVLFLRAFLGGPGPTSDAEDTPDDGWHSWLRIGAVAILMIAFFLSLPLLGMPIAGAIAIFVYALLVRARRPVTTVLTAILLPLMIYGFFSHVAGVPIPQGKIVRLP